MTPRILTDNMTRSSQAKFDSPSPSESSKDDHSTSSALFYLASNNYSEVESAYLTSEEVGYDDDDENGYFSTLLAAGPSTSILSNSQHAYISGSHSNLPSQGGIHLNQIMASLLGVGFLPFNDEEKIEKSLESMFSISSNAAAEEEDAMSSDDYSSDNFREDEGMDGIHQVPIDLGISTDLSNDSAGRKKKKGPLKRLRRQLARNDGKQNKGTRSHRRRARGKAKHRDIINGTSGNIDSELRQLEIGKRRLQEVKVSLRITQSKGKKLVVDAQRSANRVSRISKTIVELECRLDMSLVALEQERCNVDSNLAELAHLNASEQALQQESRAIESGLRNQLSRLETKVSVAPIVHVNNVELDESMHTSAPTSALNVRRRAETDGSFMTAAEAYLSSTEESRRRCVSEDIRHKSVKKKKYMATMNLSTSSSHPSEISRASSYLRIHDLDIDDEKVEQRSNSRPDLFQIDSDDGHHVLNLLMKRGFECVTDESSRWTADRSTAKIISRRPVSEQSWHYAIESDIFIWYGKFDTGYKSDVPVIKARAIMQTTPRELVNLIFDSSKVKQYNKMSLGREDRHFFKKGVDTDDGKITGEAKIVRSISSIPILKKNLELLSLMHGRSLNEEKDGMKGYIIVNRSIWEDEKKAPSDDGNGSGHDPKYIRAECLLGISLIRELEGGTCEITTINHFFTPGAPSFGARQFGMKAATNYLKDLQSAMV